jgi:PDZ domain
MVRKSSVLAIGGVSVGVCLLVKIFLSTPTARQTPQPQMVTISDTQLAPFSDTHAISKDFDGYRLQGTHISNVPNLSTALISYKLGVAAYLGVGKQLPNGWTIADITKNSVTLTKGTERATLTLSGLADPFGANSLTREDVASFLNVVRTGRGYEFGASIPQDALRAGIVPGDIIQSINNRAVSDPVRDLRILQSSAESGAAELTVRRNGRLVIVSLPLR